MTQPGETDGFTAADHLRAIFAHAQTTEIIDTVLVNDELPASLINEYKAVKSSPVVLDIEELHKLSKKIIKRKLTEDNQTLIRHNSKRLAKAIYSWYKKGDTPVKERANENNAKNNSANIC